MLEESYYSVRLFDLFLWIGSRIRVGTYCFWLVEKLPVGYTKNLINHICNSF